MHGLIHLAAVTPDNTPNGYEWTYLYPMLLFIAIGGVLYLLFSRPHRRIPSRPIALGSRSAAPTGIGGPYSATATDDAAAGADADPVEAAEGKEETE